MAGQQQIISIQTTTVDFEETRRHDKAFPGEREVCKLKAHLCCSTVCGMSKVVVTDQRVVVATGNWCARQVVSDDPVVCTRTTHTDSGAHIFYWMFLALMSLIIGIIMLVNRETVREVYSRDHGYYTTTEQNWGMYIGGLVCLLICVLIVVKIILDIWCRQVYVGFHFENRYYPIWFGGPRLKVSEQDCGDLEAAVRGVREGVLALPGDERTPKDMLPGELELFHCRTKDGHITVTNKRVLTAKIPTCCCGICLCDYFCCGARTTVIDNIDHVGRVEAMATPLFPHAPVVGILMVVAAILLFISTYQQDDDDKLPYILIGIVFLIIGLVLFFWRPFYIAIYNSRLPFDYPAYALVMRDNSGRIAFAINHAIREARAKYGGGAYPSMTVQTVAPAGYVAAQPVPVPAMPAPHPAAPGLEYEMKEETKADGLTHPTTD